jgi:hypothetical protein
MQKRKAHKCFAFFKVMVIKNSLNMRKGFFLFDVEYMTYNTIYWTIIYVRGVAISGEADQTGKRFTS